jgi:voltage-gated potassium channel
MEKCMDTWQEGIYIQGDATDNDTLIKAGIINAKGLFAITSDDNINLVISITAKQLNPKIRVVAQCRETKNSEKMKNAGADSVVSTSQISGMRMVSEMIRPTVVTFLDMMLRDTNKNLRVEEISVPPSLIGKKISEIDLSKFPNTLILAIKVKEEWNYNPPHDYIIQSDSQFIVMTTPEEQSKLRKKLAI